MENIAIAVVLFIILIIGISYTVKHFRGKGGCCGSGDLKLKRKKLDKVLYTESFTVSGMKCNACKVRVEEAVNDIRGLSGNVNLKSKELVVNFGENINDEVIIKKLRRLGYEAKRIK